MIFLCDLRADLCDLCVKITGENLTAKVAKFFAKVAKKSFKSYEKFGINFRQTGIETAALFAVCVNFPVSSSIEKTMIESEL